MSPAIDDPEVAGKSSENEPETPQPPGNAWGDRLRALKNVPPVLHFVWESGPSVVFWNIAIRVIVAFLPVGIGIIGRYIIDGVNQIRLHQPLPLHFWWLVGAEMGLAVLTGMLSRSVDYFDNLLADRYTHHVSVEVMRKAAALDVTVYEDPVFYDRLERARVQATDRLAMIQQMGRLIQQSVTAIAFSAVLIRYSPFLLLLLIAGIIPAFLGESHFAFLTYAKNFRQTPMRRQMDYLRQVGGSKEAAKELKLFNLQRLPHRPFFGALKSYLRAECGPQSPASLLGRPAGHPRPAWLLRRVRLQHLSHHSGPVQRWRPDADHHGHHAVHGQHPAGIFNRIRRSRPGALPHRPHRIFRDEAESRIQGRRSSSATTYRRAALNSAMSPLPIRALRAASSATSTSRCGRARAWP